MEEIVVGGGIAGIIRYHPRQRRWEPLPRPEACILMAPKKRFVVVDDGAIPFIRDQGCAEMIFIDPVDKRDVCGKCRPGITRRCHGDIPGLFFAGTALCKNRCMALITPA
jgi:hypothetical protein